MDDITERTGLTSGQRRLRAEIAAHALWGRAEDPAAHTAPARKAFLDKFERWADPEGLLHRRRARTAC